MTDPRRFIFWGPEQVENCIAYLRTLPFPDGKKVRRPFRAVIEKHVESVSEEQRGGFHLLVALLARETGYTPGEMKLVIKDRVWGHEEKSGPDGKVYRFIRSSERDENGKPTPKDEYGPLIDECYKLGGELGITLPILDKWHNGIEGYAGRRTRPRRGSPPPRAA